VKIETQYFGKKLGFEKPPEEKGNPLIPHSPALLSLTLALHWTGNNAVSLCFYAKVDQKIAIEQNKCP